MKRFIVSVLSLALTLGGCTRAVIITEPDPTAIITAPITRFAVQFAPQFVPNTFRAELDGQDVTQAFLPVATAGGTSRMNLPDTPGGFIGGAMFGQSAPPKESPVVVIGPGYNFPPGQWPANVPSGIGSGTTGTPPPNIAFHHHLLRVTGQCNGVICATADESLFLPIHLVGNPMTLPIRKGQTVLARIETWPVNTEAFDARVRPSSASVRLENMADGALLIVKVPAGGPSPFFKITGRASGNLFLTLEARGTQVGSITGTVDP